jgi:hypothetical protein
VTWAAYCELVDSSRAQPGRAASRRRRCCDTRVRVDVLVRSQGKRAIMYDIPHDAIPSCTSLERACLSTSFSFFESSSLQTIIAILGNRLASRGTRRSALATWHPLGRRLLRTGSRWAARRSTGGKTSTRCSGRCVTFPTTSSSEPALAGHSVRDAMLSITLETKC